MPDPAVTAYLTKLLCSQGGRVERGRLADLLDLPEEQIEQILQEDPLRFPQSAQLVVARSPLRICTRYLHPEGEEDEDSCPKLHLCRHYMRGQCHYNRRPRCRFSHDVLSDHNRAVLKANELSGLNEEEIKVLLFQNDNQLLPEGCREYTKDSCAQGEGCPRLHVCHFFLRGECRRYACRKSHNLMASPLVRSCHWLSQEIIQNFQMLCVLKQIENQQAQREEHQNEGQRGARGLSRGRGRGRPRERRAGSQDLLDSRSRERRNEGPRTRWRSNSRPPSQCSAGGEEHFPNRFENLTYDQHTANKHHHSQAVPLMKGLMMSSPVMGPALVQPVERRSASGTTYTVQRGNNGSTGAAGADPPLKLYQPHQYYPPYKGYGQESATGPSGAESNRTTSKINSTSLKPSTIPNTFSSSRENLHGSPKPAEDLTADLYTDPSPPSSNRPVTLSSSTPPSNSPTKRPSTSDMATGEALGSSMTRLSIAPTTPSRISSMYSTTEGSIAQPTNSSVPGPRNVSSSVGADTPSSKPQASVTPASNTGAVSGAQTYLSVEELDFFLQPTKPANSTATQPKPTTDISSVPLGKGSLDSTPEICLTNVWSHCNLGVCCPNMHYTSPYRWQVFNGRDWDDFPNMEAIEKSYSDPNIDRYQMIDFQTMKSGFNLVRRLSTPSSVTRPPEYMLTTEWCWYWKNEFGSWTEYGQLNTENMSSSIQSSDLETIFLSDPTGTIPFSAGKQNYIIDCKEMKQRNEYFKTERAIRRRPKFLDLQKVKQLRGSKNSVIETKKQPKNNGIYPGYWDMTAKPEIGYTKVLLAQDSSEFSNIAAMFYKTVSDHMVKKVWRIQNSSLWQLYQWQKEQMMKKSISTTVDERQLFHGTQPANIDAICSQNFDWRICGTNGTVYGQGSYFARDASYSHHYSPPSIWGTRTMFVARVLVGDFIKGEFTMKLPPQKPSGSLSYDSCVDNVYNPSIFVVFENRQVYPEYILEYEA